MSLRILVVAAHFPPDLGALATRVHDLGRAWVALGHEVHVLCGLPSHPTGVVPPRWRGRLYSDEVVDGIFVHRTWIYPTPNAGRVRRSLAYASFAASVLAIGQRRVEDPDVVIATSPQFLAAVSGALLSRGRRVPLVLEIRDLWPRSIWEVGAMSRHHPAIKVLEQLERWLYRQADEIVVVSEAFRAEIANHLPGVQAQDLPVITNGVRLERFDPKLDGGAVRARLGLPRDKPLALYAGTHGLAHGLSTVIQAARRAPEVHWAFVGEGACKEALRVEADGAPNITFHPGVGAEGMPEIYAMADLCLVPLRDLEVFRTVLPSKMFEIWAMGRPLVLGVAGEAARLAERSGASVVVPPEDPVALAQAVCALSHNEPRRQAMGEAGRAFVEAHFDRRQLALRYAALLDRVARRRTSASQQRGDPPKVGTDLA
ncbi:MAG: glycosyltransferase WbuB [Deltaproteobacteria bacterium]|nr:MAG: glycosyltransferase WbuB [Deltaproteobacteria bacterium]